MRTLETTRVCIIDDEVDEYLPLIHALSRLRFGSIHIAGDKVEDLPEEPLPGLRLVFLDMKLGTEGDDALVAAHTAQVFSRVVSSSSAPLLVVVWTKHKDLVETFRTRLFEAYPEYQGKLLFTRIEKPIDGTYLQADELREAVSAEMRKFYPAEILWRWEQLVHDAATATTEEICKHASKRAKIEIGDSEELGTAKLQKGLSEILQILLMAEAEQNMTPETAFADLLGVLNPLHSDRLEHAVEPVDAKAAENLVTTLAVSATDNEKLELNSMLIVARHGEDPPFRPGVVFRITDSANFETRFGVSIYEVFGDLLCVPKPKDYKNLKARLKSGNLDIAQREEVEAQIRKKDSEIEKTAKEWLARCIPILIDVSPACDFAQRKPRLAKLLSALMVPHGTEVICQEEQGAFRRLPVVKIPSRDESWDIVMCSRFGFNMPPLQVPPDLEAIYRLRDPILNDIRAWSSAQDGRIGYSYI